LQNWKNDGAEILYLTSRKKSEEIQQIQNVLKKFKFPDGQLLFRQKDEEYKDVAERIVPDALVEDDCESIGGIDEMTITHVKPEIKKKIKSIPIKEFGGIDHLPDKISAL
jgi:predicted secreted acid phosphatase